MSFCTLLLRTRKRANAIYYGMKCWLIDWYERFTMCICMKASVLARCFLLASCCCGAVWCCVCGLEWKCREPLIMSYTAIHLVKLRYISRQLPDFLYRQILLPTQGVFSTFMILLPLHRFIAGYVVCSHMTFAFRRLAATSTNMECI